jgi:Spy/CpxP family protein refolding chaperone
MMKNRTFLATLGVALLGILVAGAVCIAQGRGNGHGEGRGGDRGAMMAKAFDKLNLTADQKAKIKSLRDQFQQTNSAALADLKSLRDQMKAARDAKNADQAKSIGQQMRTKMEALKPAREQLRQQILAILTPEQKAQLDQMKADRQQKMQDWKGKRGQGHQQKSDDLD